jgi:tRNA (cmo5U34)-methyltransferase
MSVTNEFDLKATSWDENPMNHERAEAISKEMQRLIPMKKEFSALEFGAGTGILSFLLREKLGEIILMDSSMEMVKVTSSKIEKTGVRNLKPLFFDLVHENYNGKPFDLIYTQMVLHHIEDVEKLFIRFRKLLNKDGYLAVADLYTEDGDFHGENFKGHKGFDLDKLSAILTSCDFQVTSAGPCFSINRAGADGKVRTYPVFLLVAKRN